MKTVQRKQPPPPKTEIMMRAPPAPPPTPPELLSQAIAAGASIETIERMSALVERWEEREARKAFGIAFSAAKAKMPIILKTGRASFGQGKAAYSYETLPEIVRTVQPLLQEHGLVHRFRTKTLPDGRTEVTCVISHEMGYREESSLEIAHDRTGNKNEIQALGSALTYAERMLLKAALGLAADVDDDGASAGQAAHISMEQASALRDALEPANYPESMLCSLYKILALELLPADKFNEAMGRVKKREAEINKKRAEIVERRLEQEATKDERSAAKDTGVVSGESRPGNG
jgi:hypothetical protein